MDVPPLRVVPSIESARAIWNVGSISSWKSTHGPVSGGVLSGLLVRKTLKLLHGYLGF